MGTSRNRTCFREGCRRRRPADHTYCSQLCMLVDNEMLKAQRVCEALGDNALTTELWTSVVAFNDAFSDVSRLHAKIRDEVESAGITREEWQAIVRRSR